MTAQSQILHIVVAGQIGGAERLLVDLARNSDRHAAALMTPNRALAEFLGDNGVTVYDRGRCRENQAAYGWRSYGPNDIAWLGSIIASTGAGILHCHTYGSHVLAARTARRCGLPLVRTEHGVRHYRDWTCSLNRHWALKQTTRIVAVSGFVGRFVANIEPAVKDRIVVIPNGVDLNHFLPTPPPCDGPFTVAVAARLEPIKRLDIAIRAVAMVPGIHCEIAGTGAERRQLEKLVRTLGLESRVRFHGHLDDTRKLIAKADAVINTTREEALSLSILEAGAQARPAIAFNQGGIPEAIVDGRTGWLVAAQSPEALAAVLRIAGADRSELARRGREARAWVMARFGLDKMGDGYDAVYRSLA